MEARIRVGRLLLLGTGILAQVEKIDPNGFEFTCINGAWKGYFDLKGIVSIGGRDGEKRECEITCYDQPPAEIAREGYNLIIPWMLSRIDKATAGELELLPKVTPEPEREFVVTCTETHTATYVVKAKDREDAKRIWEQMDWSAATDRTLLDSSDIKVEDI